MQRTKVLPPVYFLGALALTALLHYIVPLTPVIPALVVLGVATLLRGAVRWL